MRYELSFKGYFGVTKSYKPVQTYDKGNNSVFLSHIKVLIIYYW